ncbi:MAG: hypothetical protein HQL91_07710 [Magnetococcales bacterium]|nr:hypothetical protein [Magnetococcales bacterium]
MSNVGMIGSSEAFKANLLNLRQNLQELVTPLSEATPGLPWQRSNAADEYRAPQPDFENVLRDALSPDDASTDQSGSDSMPDRAPPAKPGKNAPHSGDSLPPQLTRNTVDFEQRLAQQSANATFFNYNVKSAGGHYRTELARTAYTNAMGRFG